MRVTSDLWVSALLRQVFSAGGFGAVLQRGGESAGAIFIVTRNRMGEATLFGPAPQTGYSDAKPDERLFVELLMTTDEAKIDEKLAREKRFDPDLWLIEIEAGNGSAELFPVMKL
jgi:hypothetical protein